MLIWTMKFDKKKAAFWVVMAALVIIGIILLLGARDHGAGANTAGAKASSAVKTEKARVAFLADCGWSVETPALKEETVLIPKQFNAVFETYNDLQKQQGFDLSRYAGKEVKLYTYKVVGSNLGENVIATLYVSGGNVVGGDVHSTALDGFMCGLKEK
jgi:hypothetical protein